MFDGAEFLVLIECKYHNKPVRRDDLILLEGKRVDLVAQKAMLFSTSGFQKGALRYAKSHKIATITFKDGHSTYETFDRGGTRRDIDWYPYKYVGEIIELTGSGISCHRIDDDYTDAIREWFGETGSARAR